VAASAGQTRLAARVEDALPQTQCTRCGYPDCRGQFLGDFERLAASGTRAGVLGRAFRVHAPLLSLTKGEIVREASRLDVDLGLTLSCYDPSPAGAPCRRCDACVLRAKGFREAGLADPALAQTGP